MLFGDAKKMTEEINKGREVHCLIAVNRAAIAAMLPAFSVT